MKLCNRKLICIFLLTLLTASAFTSIGVTAPLAHAYVPSASFTCRTFDRGLDTDGNGLYDYLEVKVEVNITQPDLYSVSIENLLDSKDNYLWIQNETTVGLNAGIHNVTVLLYGPEIAVHRFNSTRIYWIWLVAEHGGSLNKQNVSLSRVYAYTEFDSPFNDLNVKLIVYPDGRVAAVGTLNATHMENPNDVREYLNFVIKEFRDGFWWTNGSSLLYLPEASEEFPLNSTYFSSYNLLSNGILYDKTNATMFLPPEISQVFPFNATDVKMIGTFDGVDLKGSIHVTLIGNLTTLPMMLLDLPLGLNTTVNLPLELQLNYDKGKYNGTLTLYLLEGFPVKFFEADFNGSLSSLCLNGSADVIYGEYGPPINMSITYEAVNSMVTSLEDSLNGTVFNMTGGMLEAPTVDFTLTNITMGSEVIGARVSFKVCIQEVEGHKGVALFALTRSIWEGFSLNGSEGVWLLHALNDTLNKIQNAKLKLTYKPSTTTTELWINGTIHVKSILKQMLEPVTPPEFWPWEVPPEINSTVLPYAWFPVKMLNATLSSFKNASILLSYSGKDGRVDLNATSTMDLQALEKSMNGLMSELEESSPPLPEPLPPLDEIITLLNLSYVNVTWSEIDVSYGDGVLELKVASLSEGNLNDEADRIFHLALKEFPEPPPQDQFEFLNATYLDLSDFHLNLTVEFYSIKADMRLAAYPPTDPINATSFQLTRFFNFTCPPDFPDSLSKLSVRVEGGANATHRVLVRWPDATPMPDVLDPYGRFAVWNNVSICNITPLVFTIVSNMPPTILEPTAYPASIYRKTQNVTISANIVNDLAWETPQLTQVYVNIKDPSGAWVNNTYVMSWNGTRFVWTNNFEGKATGNYIAVINATDLYGNVAISTLISFIVMNNSPKVSAVTISKRSLNVEETITGSVNASDVEGSISVKVAFRGPDGWHNVTATLSGGVYAFSISTAGWSSGDYTVYAVATDADGATTTYQDPQKVTLASPLPMTLILGAVGAVAVIVAVLFLLRRGKSPI
jgi:hypothetical protein